VRHETDLVRARSIPVRECTDLVRAKTIPVCAYNDSVRVLDGSLRGCDKPSSVSDISSSAPDGHVGIAAGGTIAGADAASALTESMRCRCRVSGVALLMT